MHQSAFDKYVQTPLFVQTCYVMKTTVLH